jgi:hypothetical protein
MARDGPWIVARLVAQLSDDGVRRMTAAEAAAVAPRLHPLPPLGSLGPARRPRLRPGCVHRSDRRWRLRVVPRVRQLPCVPGSVVGSVRRRKTRHLGL